MTRLNKLLDMELYDENLIKAINTRVLPVAMHPMNMCKMSKAELNELDMSVKRVLSGKICMVSRAATKDCIWQEV